MQSNPFESQLERLARTLTEEYGVNVLCQGDEAWTDGTRIVLPSLPEPMDEALERMVVGFLDHEMGHVAFSDFNMVGEFSKKHPGREGMLNVVEDALIERRLRDHWPGVRANLDAMFAQIRDRIIALVAKRDTFGKFCTVVYLKLSHHRDMLGLESHVAGYNDLFDTYPSVQDTRNSAHLAERILDRWEREQPRTTNVDQGHTDSGAPPPESCDADISQMPDSHAGSDQAAPQSPDDGHSGPSQEPNEADSPSPKNESSQKSGNRPDQAAESVAEEQPEPSNDGSPSQGEDHAASTAATHVGRGGDSVITEALARSIGEHVRNSDPSREYRPFTHQYDRIELVPAAGEQETRELLKTGADTIRRLRRGLANALRSAEKRWWREDQTGGTLSPRTLYRLCTDQPRLDVFRTRSMVQGRSTAVCILLDASGSMTSRKMSVARDAMRALLDALGDLKVATEAFTFTTGHEFDLNRACLVTGREAQELRERFSRFANLEIGVIKRFDEPVKAAMRRLPSIHGSGLTPLGEAMHIGAGRLITRPETRKIMLVLTDGRAGCESRDDAATLHAKYTGQRIEKAGIELVGVGIMDDSVSAIVADTIVVHALEELPAQLCKLLGRTLKKGMRHVG